MDITKKKLAILRAETSLLVEQPIPSDKTVQEIARYLSRRHYALNTHVFEMLRLLTEDHIFHSRSSSKPSRLICCVGNLPEEPRQVPAPQGELIDEVLRLTETRSQNPYESSGYNQVSVGIGSGSFFPEFDVSMSLDDVADDLKSILPNNWGEFRYQEGWVFLLSDEAVKRRLTVKTDRTTPSNSQDRRQSVDKEITFLLSIGNGQNKLPIRILEFQVDVKPITKELIQLWQDSEKIKVDSQNIRLLIGDEIGVHDIQLTPNISIETLREALARHHKMAVNQIQLFQAIPLSITHTAGQLHQIAQQDLLYVARDLYTSRKTTLQLVDVQHGSQCVWTIPPIYGVDNPVFVGRKSGTEVYSGTVHVDLAITKAVNVKRVSHQQCVLFHQDGEWYVSRHTKAKSGREIFVNTRRVLPEVSVPLNDGDSLTFGLSTQDLSVRLQVRLVPYDRGDVDVKLIYPDQS